MWIWCAMNIMSNEVSVADCTVPGLWQVTQKAKSLRPPPWAESRTWQALHCAGSMMSGEVGQATARYEVMHAVGDQRLRRQLDQLVGIGSWRTRGITAQLYADTLCLGWVVAHARVFGQALGERVLVLATAEHLEHAHRGVKECPLPLQRRSRRSRIQSAAARLRALPANRVRGRVGPVHPRDVTAPFTRALRWRRERPSRT